jgi:hypothetical protein
MRLPYIDLGPDAFSGRSLDERVINPFLHGKSIPCSKGPYLSCFRRKVRFDDATRAGLKDRVGYDAFLVALATVEREKDPEALSSILDYLLYRFVLLREGARVQLVRLERISVAQYDALVRGLLATPSGGVFPVLLVLAMVETLRDCFSLAWEVGFQGINVSDKASGAGGDITVKEGGANLLTVEVTERQVDAARVQATFSTKIAPGTLSDYVFMVHLRRIEEAAMKQAERYFTHGYDVTLVDIREWLVNTLVTVGAKGRRRFQDNLLARLAAEQVPKALKIAWNQQIGKLTE